MCTKEELALLPSFAEVAEAAAVAKRESAKTVLSRLSHCQVPNLTRLKLWVGLRMKFIFDENLILSDQ